MSEDPCAPPPVEQGSTPDEFRRDVVEGLGETQKRIPCKYFYDEEGARLFEEITKLPEYYPTRTERGILTAHAEEMAELIGPRCLLVEPGSGSSEKTEILLDALEDPVGYVPIDISRDPLLATAARLRTKFPKLPILPVVADYTASVELPESPVPPERRVVFFPGSTIGNFHPDDAVDFLRWLGRLVGEDGGLLIGVDVRKNPEILERAYDDKEGVTARFNLNVLVRANRELHANFVLDQFEHRAIWNDGDGRVEMHLVSRREQSVSVGDHTFSFRKGESIWTESAHKYGPDEFLAIAGRAGFRRERRWIDDDGLFSVEYHTLS